MEEAPGLVLLVFYSWDPNQPDLVLEVDILSRSSVVRISNMLALESNHIGVFHSKDLTLLQEAHASRSSTRLLLKILPGFSFHGSSTLQLVGCCCWIPAAPS